MVIGTYVLLDKYEQKILCQQLLRLPLSCEISG